MKIGKVEFGPKYDDNERLEWLQVQLEKAEFVKIGRYGDEEEYDIQGDIEDLIAELARKDEEIDRLREALEFYENRDNYTKPSPESDYGFTPIEKDVGAKAREALQRSTG